MLRLLLFILVLGNRSLKSKKQFRGNSTRKNINKKRGSQERNAFEIVIPKIAGHLPANYTAFDVIDNLKRYLHTSVTVFIQTDCIQRKFSGILINVANDYIEILNIKFYRLPLSMFYKNYIISIPINKIAAVTYFQV
jgi:hypothetical protein